uniref:(3R)-3-hydroxyacyl-CoA dehydrogenase n=1 Tax=Phallusia mammillata TaxID=59560 RepID=A0A6F9DE56_9ASCI|nr:estradiol 17-beta-dehydrogenase 8-like [Phallusia mammillata]
MGSTRLLGKYAIVTGAGSGIGHAICRIFASEGASVLLVDRNEPKINELSQKLDKQHENDHHCIAGDVSNSGFASSLFEKSQTLFERKGDILVNCAGITRDSLLLNMSEKQFDDVIQVNLKSIFLMTQAYISDMKSSGELKPASIVNISSIVGKGGNVGQANYAASKAGVIGFTKSVGIEMGRFGIRCNAVLPGFIQTPMTQVVPEKVLNQMIHLIPAKRIGNPEEVAKACLFLASDESSYVNCSCLEVTGGLMA